MQKRKEGTGETCCKNVPWMHVSNVLSRKKKFGGGRIEGEYISRPSYFAPGKKNPFPPLYARLSVFISKALPVEFSTSVLSPPKKILIAWAKKWFPRFFRYFSHTRGKRSISRHFFFESRGQRRKRKLPPENAKGEKTTHQVSFSHPIFAHHLPFPLSSAGLQNVSVVVVTVVADGAVVLCRVKEQFVY